MASLPFLRIAANGLPARAACFITSKCGNLFIV